PIQQSRPPAVAGLFYPQQGAELRDQVETLIAAARKPDDAELSRPKVLIAPHAGYVYSGAVAGSAYARITACRGRVDRVVLLGPAHRVRVRGLATPTAEAFSTPLGEVPLDRRAIATIAELPQAGVSDLAHAQEHSLEVHLPFLQQALGEFRLVPLVVGDASGEAVAEVLELLWGGDETLIVISSDLSHYLPYPRACAVDEFTAETILRLRPQLNHEQACGATPINGLLLAAHSHQLRPQLIDLRNSGDTAGDKSRVVGYAAFAFYEPTH
ncbi:MAG: AmmeMemoRadiSam system protein B, partial [Burkholderiales bacterium]